MTEIKLGQKVKDVVSGFEGIAISKIEYLNGCIQYCVKPKVTKKEESKMPDGEWIDIRQLKIVKGGILKEIEKSDTGGDTSKAPTHNGISKL